MRPNKLQVKAYDAQLVADGKVSRHGRFSARPGADRGPSGRLTMPLFDCDAILARALSDGPVGPPLQLALLMDKDPLKWLCSTTSPSSWPIPARSTAATAFGSRSNGRRALGAVDRSGDLRPAADDLPPLDLSGASWRSRASCKASRWRSSSPARSSTRRWIPKLFTFDLPKDAETVKYFVPSPARLLERRRRRSASSIWPASPSRASRWPRRSWSVLLGQLVSAVPEDPALAGGDLPEVQE